MLRQLWSFLFGWCDNDFFKYNVREKMALIIIFVLAVIVVFTKYESETIKYVIVGLLTFLKGDKGQAEVNDNIQQQIAKEKEQLQRTIITEKPKEEVIINSPKPVGEVQ